MKKQAAALLLAVLMVVGSLAGCSGGGSKDSANDSSKAQTSQSAGSESSQAQEPSSNFNAEGYPIVNETVELSVFQYCRDADQIDWPNLWFYKNLEEKTGVHATFDVAIDSEWDTKLNLMLASNEYNDVVINRKTINYEEYGVSQEIFIPLDNLIDQYMPTYKARIAQDPTIVESLKASDGQTYSIGYIVAQDIHTGNMYFINKSWLDKVGMEVPTTVDQLTEVLRAFKTQDANGNGDANDEVPLDVVLTDFYKMSFYMFGIPESDIWVSIDDDAQVRCNAQIDGYRDALEWMHQIYEEGLVDSEVLTKGGTMVTSDVLAGTVGTMFRWRLLNHGIDEVKDQYVNMLPPSAEGKSAKMYTTMEVAAPCALITVANEYPEVTARWLDSMLENQTAYESYYGPQGELWDYNAEGKAELKGSDQDCVQYCPGVNGLFYGNADWYFSTFAVPDFRLEKAAYDDAYTEAGVYEKYPADYLNKLITLTTDENTVLLLHKTDLTNLISEMISNSIMHGVSDAEWDAFQTNLQNAGIEEYVQTYQAALDRFLAE